MSRTISSNNINAIVEDPDGSLWIGTENGLNKFNGDTYLVYSSDVSTKSLNNDYITSLSIGKRGELLIGTQIGITVFDGKTFKSVDDFYSPVNPIKAFKALDENTYIYFDSFTVRSIDANTFSSKGFFWGNSYNSSTSLEITDKKEIWIDVNKHPNREIQILDSHLHPVDSIKTTIESTIVGTFVSEDSRYWVYDNNTVLCYNTKTHKKIDLPSIDEVIGGGEILSVNKFRDDTILLGLRNKGLIVYDYMLGSYRQIVLHVTLPSQETNVFVDSKYNLLIHDNMGPFRFFSETDNVKRFMNLKMSLRDKTIHDITYTDSGELLLVGLKDVAFLNPSSCTVDFDYNHYKFIDGLALNDNSIWVLGTTGSVAHVFFKGSELIDRKFYSLPSFAYSIVQDKYGHVWLLSHDSLFRIDHNGAISKFPLPSGSFEFVPSKLISTGMDKEVFLISNEGIYRVDEAGKVERLSLNYNTIVSSIEKGSDGTYWIGTNHGLLNYNHSTKEVTTLTVENGLPGNAIQKVIMDKENNLWVISSNGICQILLRANRIITLPNKDYSDIRFAMDVPVTFDGNGSLYIGDGNGIIKINSKVSQKSEKRKLTLSSIKVDGVDISELNKSIALNYKNHDITFTFPYSDINPQSQIKYRYKFDSKDSRWTYINTFPSVSYQNLAPGRYTFIAQIINPDGSWSEDGIVQPFRIRRMPLTSNIALLIYALLAFAFIYLIFRTKMNRERYMHADKLNKASENMIDTLTNITHELRTPLTLIYAPVKELLSMEETSDKEKELLGVVEGNVDRLKRLTDHLIDYGKNKIDEDNLIVGSVKVGLLLRQIVENFRFLTIDKDIELSSDIDSDIDGWIDLKKVETIVNNLLSNAIKYTPSGGHVFVKVEPIVSDGMLRVSFKDDGIGIDESRRKDLFTRYNRLGNENSQISGSGIGLNYASYLAMLHKGSLDYLPVDPQGSEFILTIPYVKFAFSEKAISQAPSLSIGSKIDEIVVTETNKEKTALIVDDDTEIVSYIANLFKNEWNIQVAHNGQEAYTIATEIVPDIIISDVVMPIKDGYELCRNIRENVDINHIPIILLTAKDDAKSKLQGLDTGADA
ncbi:MAG: response regulator [Bacteroidales bacterium]|nr:response regulator [Bacteroidales bacterium]